MASTVKSTFYWALTALQISDNNCKNVLSSDNPNLHKDLMKSQILTIDSQTDTENIKPTFSRDSVADHCTHDSCWIIINNKVYDVTRFLRLHPGGDDIILEYGGCDATAVFIDKGHSDDAYDSLADYLIGEVTQEDKWPEKRKW